MKKGDLVYNKLKKKHGVCVNVQNEIINTIKMSYPLIFYHENHIAIESINYKNKHNFEVVGNLKDLLIKDLKKTNKTNNKTVAASNRRKGND